MDFIRKNYTQRSRSNKDHKEESRVFVR